MESNLAAQKSDDNMQLTLINLPDLCLEMILSKLSYDEISKCTTVCKKFDTTCKLLLKRSINLMDKYHDQCLCIVESKFSRQESDDEQETQLLACHDMIKLLSIINRIIGLLLIIFTEYINRSVICFPGKVIDNVFQLLRSILQCTETLPKIHGSYKEFRGIMSTRINLFHGKIERLCLHDISVIDSTDILEIQQRFQGVEQIFKLIIQ